MLIVCSAQGTCDHSNGPSDSINGGQVLRLLMGNVIHGFLQGYSQISVHLILKLTTKSVRPHQEKGRVQQGLCSR